MSDHQLWELVGNPNMANPPHPDAIETERGWAVPVEPPNDLKGDIRLMWVEMHQMDDEREVPGRMREVTE